MNRGEFNRVLRHLLSYSINKCDLNTMVGNVNFFLRALTVNIDNRNTKHSIGDSRGSMQQSGSGPWFHKQLCETKGNLSHIITLWYKKPSFGDYLSWLLPSARLSVYYRPVTSISVTFYILTIIGLICYYYVYVVSVVWYVFVHYPATGDFIGTVIIFSIGAFTETCPIKLLFMIMHRKLIANVVERYLRCDAQIDLGSRLHQNIQSHLRTVKKRGTTIWLTLVIIAEIHCFTPFFLPGRHFPDDKYILYGLEPMIESPNYEIATVILTITISSATYYVANCTAFMVMLLGYTEAQILSLSEELLNVWNDAERETEHIGIESRSSAINNFISERLTFIIKLHNENITLLKQIEGVLRVSMALEFLFLMAGLIAAMLGGIKHTYLEIPFAFAQIFMNCYLGQKIINASETFERAVYDCKWELFDKTNMRTVSIVLQNSQKTLNLSAGGVAILSFQCLMSVIKSSYSFYTTLQSTLKY